MRIISLVSLIVITLGFICDIQKPEFTRFNKLNCGLYSDSVGRIYYKVYEGSLSEKTHQRRFLYWVYGHDTIDSNGNIRMLELRDFIDTSTFQFLSEYYWRDKNNLLFYTPMSDGGTMALTYLNPDSFELLGSGTYGRYIDSIYYRAIKIDQADAKTFKVIDALKSISEDENYRYEGYTIVDTLKNK